MSSRGEVRYIGPVVESIELLKLVESRSKVLGVGEARELALKRCFRRSVYGASGGGG
jgi:hypothetical protein